MKESKTVSKRVLTQPLSYPGGLPRDVWALIAGFLDIRDLGRFAQVCVAFHHVLSVTNGKVLDAWFRELKRQCEGGEEVSRLLDYCQLNIRDTRALLPVLDRLLHIPGPGEPVPVFEDPVVRAADTLARTVYADPRNNARDTLRRALMSIIENNDHLIARSEVIVQRDKNFDWRIDQLSNIGFGVVLMGFIVQFSQWGNHGLAGVAHMPFMMTGFFMGVGRFYKDSGIVGYAKNRGFWLKVDALPSEELNKIPHIKSIRDGFNANWDSLKFAFKMTAGSLAGIFLLTLLLIRYLSSDVDIDPSRLMRRSSGP